MCQSLSFCYIIVMVMVVVMVVAVVVVVVVVVVEQPISKTGEVGDRLRSNLAEEKE